MFFRASNIPRCILELVLNSLSGGASSVAIRVNLKERKIQVVDNGTGMCECALRNVGERSLKRAHKSRLTSLYSEEMSTLCSVRQNCSALAITSRYYNSKTTYMKVFRYERSSKILKTENRPSCGTTVTVYGFHETPCNCKSTISEICILITYIALTYSKVSFSIRDDQRQKVLLKIGKPHTPLQIFKLLYRQNSLPGPVWHVKDRIANRIKFSTYIMFAKEHSKISRCFILNGRPVFCPLVLDLISNTFAEAIHSSKNAQSLENKTLASWFITCSFPKLAVRVQNGTNGLIFNHIYSLIARSVANYIFNMSPQTKSNTAEITHQDQDVTVPNKCNGFSQFTSSYKNVNADSISINSEWSSWSYHDNVLERPILNNNDLRYLKNYKSYDFVPKNLQALLKYANVKLTKATTPNGCNKRSLFSDCMKPPSTGNVSVQNIKVRSCTFMQRLCKFTLRKQSIIETEILRQVNNEVIAGITVQDNVKLLLMIDQHAVDERIRYENLLHEYTTSDKKNFISINLEIPLTIKFPKTTYLLLSTNQMLLRNFGVKFTVIDEEIMSIHSVPKCLAKTYWRHDNVKLEITVQNLLYEIVQNLESGNIVNNLPFTIHHAIATEACHGAIKFGDVLNYEQCTWLVKLLKDIKCPNRCAHGRPSVVPIIQLSELEKRYYKNIKNKLNFSSLKNYCQMRRK